MPESRAKGVDVSRHHPIVDWDALLASGVSFIGAKATQGPSYVDPWFARHRQGAADRTDRVLLALYYHFSVPGDARAQARHLLAVMGELAAHERLVLDVEGEDAPNIHWIDAFVGELPKDRRHLVYTSKRIWDQIGNPHWARAADVDLWAPRYQSGGAEPKVPAPWSRWTFWQYSDREVVPGVDGPCDANWFNGSVEELRRYAELRPVVANADGLHPGELSG